MNLHLEKGATIVGVDEAEDYPMRETRIEGETCVYYPALVNADGCDGFTISGEGVIDGHGAGIWEEFWAKRAAARKAGRELRNKDLMRPRVLYVSNSKSVDVSGVTVKNSKFWTTHYCNCEDVCVHDCTIVAEILKDSQGKVLKGPSTDAVDIDKCRRFTVRNCTVDGIGNLLYLKMRTDTPQRYSNVLVEGVSGTCKAFLNVGAWGQYADFGGRTKSELKSYARGVTLRGNTVTCEAERIGKGEGEYFELTDLVLENNVLKSAL